MVDWVLNDMENREILAMQPAPAGWFACYVNRYDREERRGEFIVLPVALWVTIGLTEGEYQRQEIRAFVARITGEVLDAHDIDLAFVCLTPPDHDPIQTALAILASDETRIITAPNAEELVS